MGKQNRTRAHFRSFSGVQASEYGNLILKAKNCEERRSSKTLQKFREITHSGPQKFRNKNLELEKRNVGDCLKRVMVKFHANQSSVRGVNDRSKFRK